jgi:uncharacterized protein involved in type VI secretion and phage assembly
MIPYFYWATVTDNADPDGLFRVKVVKEGEEESVADWVPVLTPYGSSDTGLNFLPDVDDQVLVIALGTVDVRKAVIGSVWSDEVPPPQTGENTSADLNGDGENALRFFRSRTGNQLIFDDTEDAEKIQLISADGESRLEISVPDELFSLDTSKDLSIGAKGTITINAEEIDISSEKQFNISADECQVDAKKGLNISTDKDMSIKGSGIALN